MGKTAGPHLPDYFPRAAKTGKCGTEVGGWCRGAVQVRLIMGGVLLAPGSPCCVSQLEVHFPAGDALPAGPLARVCRFLGMRN